MMNSINSSQIYRQSRETLAIALMEQAQRRMGNRKGLPQPGLPQPGLPLPVWTARRRALLMPERPFDLTRHRYLAGVYACRAREMVVYKAGQLGVSEYLVSYALHAADERLATVLYVMPTDTHVSDFSSARIGPAIEASSYLASIVVEGAAAGGKRGADRVTLKRVRNRFIYLRGAQVDPKGNANQLKSIDADVLIIDEEDEMDPRAIPIAQKRLGHSAIGEIRKVSTPTYSGFGIHAEWMKTDQREWFVRCPHCGNRQPLTIDDVVTEFDELGRPRRWHGDLTPGIHPHPSPLPMPGKAAGKAPASSTGTFGGEGAYAACRKCGKPVDRLGPGEWVATRHGVEIAGFHVTKLFSPTTPLIAIVQNLDTVDETARKEAVNQDLGEPYTPRGGQMTDDQLDSCRREYAHGPIRKEVTVMGVDVGKILHTVIRGPIDPETGERPQRFAGEVESWERLLALAQQYHAGAVVIDALPETTKAREFQTGYKGGKVWLAYYVGQKTGTKNEDPRAWNWDEGVVNLDRTRTLDEMTAAFTAQSSTLPGHARDVRDYYAQMKAPVRVVERSGNGTPVALYVEGTNPDHFAHAENYCHVAMHAPRAENITETGEATVHVATELFS